MAVVAEALTRLRSAPPPARGVQVDTVKGHKGAMQVGATAQRGLAVAAVAGVDGAAEGDGACPLRWGSVAQLLPAAVGAERARY